MNTRAMWAVLFGVVALCPVHAGEAAESTAKLPPSAVDALDHFRCYVTQGEPVGKTVLLRDQFEAGEARVLEALRFCNPVQKSHGDAVTKIQNEDAHLTFYRIHTPAPPPTRQVVISNQLGKDQRLEVSKPVFLAAPTYKQSPGNHQPPKGLDHFKCYEARGASVSADLDLQDEFQAQPRVKPGEPVLFCNPVQKALDPVISRITNRDAHLTCYATKETPFEAGVRAATQFGEERLKVRGADLLCVPSAKDKFGIEPVPGEVNTDTFAVLAPSPLPHPPKFQGCVPSTPDFTVTGSETVVSGDEHCFADGANFAPRTDIPGLARVDGTDVADMDGDGDNDFLACDGTTGQVYLYAQAPAGVFAPSVIASGVTSGLGGSVFCTYLRVGDFNEDGLKDFVVGDNRVTKGLFLYLQGPLGTFTRVLPGLDITWASPTGVPCNCLFGLAVGDVDGDAHQDVLVLGYRGAGAGRLYFYKGNGAGGMAPPVPKVDLAADFPVAGTPTGLALFDLEPDGDLDLIVGGSADGSHYVYTNDGLGNFAKPAGSVFDVQNYTGIDTHDYDGDGDHDVVLVDWTTRRLLYVENMGGVLAAPLAVGIVAGPSIGIGAPQPKIPEPTGLDHFECYLSTATRPVDASVSLEDQFGRDKARVREAVRFCNPVRKIHGDKSTPIQNPDAHLKFYRIESSEPARTRQVHVSNQFGQNQKLQVSEPLFLAVPTQKRHPGQHGPAKGLDHFKCYRADGEPVKAVVDLRDQFLFSREVGVHSPFALCNPVTKEHAETVTKVQHPDDHLMCYRIDRRPFQTDVRTRDQFGEEGFPVKDADLLCVPSTKRGPVDEPFISQLCGDHAVSQFDGGEVSPGGPGTGLYRDNPDPAWPDGRPRRPCGQYVPIHGHLPPSGVQRFRIAYRAHTDPVPPLGTAPGIHTKWILYDGFLCQPNQANVLQTVGPLAWLSVADFQEAVVGGPSTNFCPNPGLRLAVWDTANNMALGPPDPNGHYVVWLEWEDTSNVLHKEPFEHHVQLDNTLPKLNSLSVTLPDGTTPVGACGEAPAGQHIFKVNADFADDYYWGYLIQVRGGNPPTTITYGWHNYHDGTPPVANTDKTGTTPDNSTVFLRDVDMTDFGVSFTDCCYLLELFVRDAAIRHSFNNRVANDTTSGYWSSTSTFITFSAAP